MSDSAAAAAARPWLLAAAVVLAWAGSATAAIAPAAAPSRALRRELDRDEALLRERLASLPDGSGVEIARELQRVILRVPAAWLFAPDAIDPKADAGSSLPIQVTVQLLKQRRRLAASVAVYTDSVGGSGANQAATEQRARAVASLLSGAGIAADRLTEYGAGERQPLSVNDTPEGRLLNRRVEIAFQPKASAAVRPVPAAASAGG